MIDQVVTALGRDLDLTSKEIADVIWLALQMDSSDTSNHDSRLIAVDQDAEKVADQLIPSIDSSESDSDTEEGITARRSPSSDAELHMPNSKKGKRDSFSSSGIPIKVPSARSLREPLFLAKALKPLIRRVSEGCGTAIDEVATVERIVNEHIWEPVAQPDLEPWMELAIVVDEKCLNALMATNHQGIKTLDEPLRCL